VKRIYQVTAAARYARELIPSVITAATSYQPATGVNFFDVDAGRRALAFDEAMRPVLARLSALEQGFEFTINHELATSGVQALEAYSWAKTHAGFPSGVGLRPYLNTMQKVVMKIQNRRKTAAPPPAPPSTTPPDAAAPVTHSFMASNIAGSHAADDMDDVAGRFERALDEVSAE
jgi:hypothetical protein